MKTICEFLRKGVFFSHSRCLPIEGTFYRRTNLMFSIRYISEKYLQDVKIATSRQNGTKQNRKCYGSKWPIPKRKNDGQMPYTRADKMSTRYSSIHSAYAHRLIPRRKSSRKEAEHSLRYCQGQERGDSGFATLRYRALSYTVTSIANVATPACPSLQRSKDTLGTAP